jgi:HPt (histidine-containing phosphotransfer) domain-containing protein
MAKTSAAQVVVQLPASRAVRPIDLVHLAKQCLGDEHLEYEILRLFDTTVKTYFGRLTSATTSEDFRLNLHSIKGAASGVGAWTIADLAKAAEADLHAGKPISPETVADLGHAVEEAGTFIAVMLSNEPA